MTQYKTEDYGMLVGLLTMPFGEEEEFIGREIKNIFESYKAKVLKNCTDTVDSTAKEVFDKHLYTPRIYGLLGSFDVAVFSLIDDFNLSTRHFHPFNSLIDPEEGDEAKNYTFHVISGICPDMKFVDPAEPSLLEKAQDTFLELQSGSYPFVGITSLKLNNALLIGNGGNLIELVLRKIHEEVKADSENKGNLACIVMHSFSWHELTLLFFSDNYHRITEKIFAIRELNFKALAPNHHHDEFEHQLFRQVQKKALISSFLPPGDSSKQLLESHLFVHTHTIFGYDIDLFLKPDSDKYAYLNRAEHGINLAIRWDIKPGHLQAFIKSLNSTDEPFQHQMLVTSGRGDYINTLECTSISAYINIVKNVIASSNNKHTRKMVSIASFRAGDLALKHENEVNEDHYFFHDYLKQFAFDIRKIDRVRASLKRLRTPKVLREKVLNMLVIYNDGIHDPVLYGYFIELKPFLLAIIKTIQKIEESDVHFTVKEVSDLLEAAVENFEIAYRNRFGQSYIMNEITDFNIEFNGGIQQLISAYDGAYKSLTALLGEQKGRSIAYVAGNPNVESDNLSVHLNYVHLYQPEFFAAAATHEAANFLFQRLDPELTGDWQKIITYYTDQLAFPQEGEAFLSSKATQYFAVDIITYELAFNHDFNLFFYWHWACMLQNATFYNTDGSLNQDIFDDYVARMLLIDCHVNQEASFFEKSIIPPLTRYNPAIQRAWESSFAHLHPQIVQQHKKHQGYFNLFHDYVQGGLIVDEFAEKLKENEGVIGEELRRRLRSDEKYEEIDEKIYDQQQQKRFGSRNGKDRSKELFYHARCTLLEDTVNIIIEAFKRKEVYSFDKLAQRPVLAFVRPSFFFHALMLAYLKLIKALNNDTCELLARDRYKGSIYTGIGETSAALKFDPVGGIVSTDIGIRKQYFLYRTLFLKSLWNLSVRYKKTLFEPDAEDE